MKRTGDREKKTLGKQVSIPVREGAVALLGAGFSRSVGLPLMSELLQRSVPSDMSEIVRCLGGFGADGQLGIEEFLTISDFEDSIRLGGRERNVSYLSSFAADIANSMFRMRRIPAFWRSVVELLDCCGTIVSLNWDTLVEIQARALGRPVSYSGATISGGTRILKPHGSIDWFRSSRTGKLSSREFFAPLFRGYLRYRPLSEEPHFFGVPEDFAALFNRVPPVIVAPTHIKAVPAGPLRRIWGEVYRALAKASDVIIIGYSMPPSDHLIRVMLQRAIRYQQILKFQEAPRIVIVDPDPSERLATRFSQVFGDDFQLVRRRFMDVRLIPPLMPGEVAPAAPR